MKYSKTTGCFYPKEIFYAEVPNDLQDVNAGEFERAMALGAGETFDVVGGVAVALIR